MRKGATLVDAAIQRERYALKDRWSTLQVLLSSQATSFMMPSRVKKRDEVFTRPSRRVRHLSDCVCLREKLACVLTFLGNPITRKLGGKVTYHIPHDRRSIHMNADIVRPLKVVYLRTVDGII